VHENKGRYTVLCKSLANTYLKAVQLKTFVCLSMESQTTKLLY